MFVSDGPGPSSVLPQLLTLLAAILGLVGGVVIGERSNETQRDVALLTERRRDLANVYADFVASHQAVQQAYEAVLSDDTPSTRDALASAVAGAERAEAKVHVFGTDEASAQADGAMRLLRATGCDTVFGCKPVEPGHQQIDVSLVRGALDGFISVARRDLGSA